MNIWAWQIGAGVCWFRSTPVAISNFTIHMLLPEHNKHGVHGGTYDTWVPVSIEQSTSNVSGASTCCCPNTICMLLPADNEAFKKSQQAIAALNAQQAADTLKYHVASPAVSFPQPNAKSNELATQLAGKKLKLEYTPRCAAPNDCCGSRPTDHAGCS